MTTVLNGKKTFGAGRFFGINNVTNPTPARFSVPQDQSITFKRDVKSLFGESQLAADVAGGSMTVTGKVTLGTTVARIFADLIFGDAGSANQTLQADKEAGTVPATTPFTITVANSASWTVDLGVRSVDTGALLTCVASASEVAGKSYSVAAGVYKFAAGDANKSFKISYLYTAANSGETVIMSNQPMGKTGNFTGVYVFPWGTEQDVITLNNCIASGTEISTKMGDYAKPTFDFEAACDNNDVLGTFSFAEAA